MEVHRKLTIIAAVLLAVTLILNNQHTSESEFNYAYITGIGMLAAIGTSLAIFTIDKMNQ